MSLEDFLNMRGYMSEKFVSEFIAALPVSGGTALDIGANHGRYTTTLARKFGRVWAFEPHPDNIEKLSSSVKDELNVKIVQKAISDQSRMAFLYQSTGNPGGHSISKAVADVETWGHNPTNFIDVEHITLDDFVEENNITNLEFMKVDIEGAEGYVFEGAKNTLKNNKLDIMLETHQTYDCNKLHNFFFDLGYKWYTEGLNQTKQIKHNAHYLLSNKR